MPRAHYVTTPHGQLRLFSAGAGHAVLVLPGLIRGGAMLAARLASMAPDISFHVLEPPGIGGSADVAVEQAEEAIAAAAAAAGLGAAPVLAFDLTAALCGRLGAPVVAVESRAARAWASAGIAPPDLAPRPDGTHLAALHAHIRDRHLLDPAEPGRAAPDGETLPDADELAATVLAAAARPRAYAALWARCLGGSLPGRDLATQAALASLRGLKRAAVVLPPTAPAPGTWRDHQDLPRGRRALRRAGARGRLLIALHPVPGAAAPLLAGLADGWHVVAPGWRDDGAPVADIARQAQDVLDLADALGERAFDLCGALAGAAVALEVAVRAPERVGRLVLEAPPLLPPGAAADMLANLPPALPPDPWGNWLLRAWNLRRDMCLFRPWYRTSRGAMRPATLPGPDMLHDWTVGALEDGAGPDDGLAAALGYDMRAALARLARPALVCVGPDDPLAAGAVPATVAVRTLPRSAWAPRPDADAGTLDAYRAFLDGQGA